MKHAVWQSGAVDGPAYLDACVLVSALWPDDPLFNKSVRFLLRQAEAETQLVVSLLALNEAFIALSKKKYHLHPPNKPNKKSLRRAAKECRRLAQQIDGIATVVGSDGREFRGTLADTLDAAEHVHGQFKDSWHFALAASSKAATLVTTNTQHFDTVPSTAPFKVVFLKE